MSEIVFINEQGCDNLSFLGTLNEEDQKTYEQSEKEEEAMRRKAGEPTK